MVFGCTRAPFTWEHDPHRHQPRALTLDALFGSHHDLVVQLARSTPGSPYTAYACGVTARSVRPAVPASAAFRPLSGGAAPGA